MNKHNETIPIQIFPISKVIVGCGTYGELNVLTYNNDEEELYIGNYCSIANDVLFVLVGEHDYHCISNFSFMRKYYKEGIDAICKGPIIIEDDVWIGARSVILSGVKLGKGCVVGAGSVITKSVPPYVVFVNGKVYKYRFSSELIKKINNQVDYSKISNNELEDFKKFYHIRVDEANIDQIIERLQKKFESEKWGI